MKLLSLLLPLGLAAAPALAEMVEIESCAGSFSYDAVPSRAITLNQQATEIMLALGLQDHMVGTAYIEEDVPAKWADAYASVPVLAEKYPAREIVMAQEPDFLFAGFSSAFSEDNLGAADEWRDLGIGTYLVNASCRSFHRKDDPLTTQPIFTDIQNIGKIFQVEDRAETLAGEIRARIEEVQTNPQGEGLTAFIYDSGDETPYTVGCCGGPALVARMVGLESITDDLEGSWADVSWETVVAADPDVIVLIEADWSTSAEKRAYMESDPVLSELRAVKDGKFVVIPFSETLLGMRFADGVETINGQLAALR